jgi:3-methyladenine DNA glycosylase AlkC
MAAGYSLKDQLFNAEKVRFLAGLFAAAEPRFDAAVFQAQVLGRLPELELKQRIGWIAECLGTQLDGSLARIAPTLRAALPPPLDPDRSDDDFGDFIFAPLGELVAMRGIEEPETALDLLEEITQRFSMEWAIRPFLIRWPDLVLDRMRHWTGHENYHVRRLVSEGSRPRLPWGQAVGLDLRATLPLLDALHGDRTRYVTRSVANHLNDISKKDPDLAMDRLQLWAEQGVQDRAELDWMTRHALRGRIKAGDARAMRTLGFDPEADIDLLKFQAPGQVAIGDALTLSVALRSDTGAAALLDYVLWRRKADGSLSPKVFKMKQIHLPAGVLVETGKAHPLRGNATTYRLFPGPHRVELQVNGRVRAAAEFELVAERETG